MFNVYVKVFATKFFLPIAKFLANRGVTPNAVTIVGTFGVLVGSLVLYPKGQLFWGSLVITICALFDTLDGTMARLGGKETKWGAFLDSTLDRVADASIFLGLILWFSKAGQNYTIVILSTICLIFGNLVSYVRARAEGLGFTASGGIAERTERLVLVLLAVGLVGLNLPVAILVFTLLVLAIVSCCTAVQRMFSVYRQSLRV